MGYLGLIVILLGGFVTYQGYTSHTSINMVIGAALVLIGIATAPWPLWRTGL